MMSENVELRKEIDDLKSREEENRKLRQEKEAELREIIHGSAHKLVLK